MGSRHRGEVQVWTKVIIGAFALLGLLVGLLVTVQRVRLYTRGVAAMGTVVATRTATQVRSSGPTQATTSPLIEVRDEVSGETFTFASSFGSTTSKLAIGSQVRVRYLPDDHTAAEVDAFLPMWFLPLGSLTVGSLLGWALTRI